MAISSASISKQLEANLNTVIGLSYPNHVDEWKQLGFSVNKATKRTEEDVIMGGLGEPGNRAEGAAIDYDVAQEGWSYRYTQQEKALAIAITQICIEDGLYINIVPKMAVELKKSFVVKKNREGAAVLNRAHTAGYTGGDGVVLCSTAHPLGGPAGGTFSNRMATAADISESTLEAMINLVTNMVDERGKPCNLRPVKLLGSSLGSFPFDAARLLQSEYRPGLNTNDINAIKSNKYIPQGFYDSQYLTDDDAVFLLTDCNDGLKHFYKRAFTSKMEGDFETDNMKLKATERYIFGFTNPRCIVSNGGGAA